MSPVIQLSIEAISLILFFLPINLCLFNLKISNKEDLKKLILIYAIAWLSCFILNRPNQGNYLIYNILSMIILILSQMAILKHSFKSASLYVGLCYTYTAFFSMILYYIVIVPGLNQGTFLEPRWVFACMPLYYFIVFLSRKFLRDIGQMVQRDDPSEVHFTTLMSIVICIAPISLQMNYVSYASPTDPFKIVDYICLAIICTGGFGLILHNFKRSTALQEDVLQQQHLQATTTLLENYMKQMHEYKNSLHLVNAHKDSYRTALSVMHQLKRNQAESLAIETLLEGNLDHFVDECRGPQQVALIYGILMDNAIEYLSNGKLNSSDKIINISCNEKGELCIQNALAEGHKLDSQLLLKSGYSTKAAGPILTRGYGLSNAKKLAEDLGAHLSVNIIDNKISFTLHTPLETLQIIHAQ